MRVLHLAIAVLCFSVLLAACQRETSGKYLLTYASPYPPGQTFSRADRRWMEAVTIQSGGRLRIKPFWSGSLITDAMSMLEVRHDVANMALITPIYARGGAHLLSAQTGFYGGVQSIDDQVAVYRCLAKQFPDFDKELKGLIVLAVQGGTLPGILTSKKPIENLEDFRGQRLRVPAEGTEVLERLGADPVNMPMSEVYSALAKGVIDGVVAAGDTLKNLHFAEIAKYYTTLRFPRGAYPARAISEKAWKRLPDDLRQILQQSSGIWESALRDEILEAEEIGLSYGKEHGIIFYDFPPDQQRRFDELYNEIEREKASELRSIGIDAVPVFETAQALIAAGSPIECKVDSKP